MFRTVPLSIIRSFSLYTQQWYMAYRCVTYTIAVFTVKKKNKFEKLVRIFGFVIRIHHDARSPERQNNLYNLLSV
jgi:hypothetical protein